MVTVGSIFGGRGMWIWYLICHMKLTRSPLDDGWHRFFNNESSHLFLSTPTLMPSSMSVGATLSARSTTNLANCFTLMIYLGINSC